MDIKMILQILAIGLSLFAIGVSILAMFINRKTRKTLVASVDSTAPERGWTVNHFPMVTRGKELSLMTFQRATQGGDADDVRKGGESSTSRAADRIAEKTFGAEAIATVVIPGKYSNARLDTSARFHEVMDLAYAMQHGGTTLSGTYVVFRGPSGRVFLQDLEIHRRKAAKNGPLRTLRKQLRHVWGGTRCISAKLSQFLCRIVR